MDFSPKRGMRGIILLIGLLIPFYIALYSFTNQQQYQRYAYGYKVPHGEKDTTQSLYNQVSLRDDEGQEAVSETQDVLGVGENEYSHEKKNWESDGEHDFNAADGEEPGADAASAIGKDDRELPASSIIGRSYEDIDHDKVDTRATERGIDDTATISPSEPAVPGSDDNTVPLQQRANVEQYNSHCAIPDTDSKLPKCPFCQSANFDSVTVFLEEFATLNVMYPSMYRDREAAFPGACQMPDGIKCILQHEDTMADVVFRMQWFTTDNHPVRYCYPQIVSMLNSEAEGPGYHDRPQVKHAEITIDFHISSEVLIADGCRIDSYRKAMTSWSPPDPREHQGVAMFLSHCKEIKWRYDFIEELLKLVHIDMHGSCFHNVPGNSDRFQRDFEESFIAKVSKYRAVLVFENHREEAYISEKIFLAYSAHGVVPIYHGAPDAHMWLPGNHTYVDATKYETPQALADYIKLLLTNDTLYQYHTTNYDTKKVINFLDQHCPPKDDYMCHLCRHAYKLKKDSFHNGTRHCNCN